MWRDMELVKDGESAQVSMAGRWRQGASGPLQLDGKDLWKMRRSKKWGGEPFEMVVDDGNK